MSTETLAPAPETNNHANDHERSAIFAEKLPERYALKVGGAEQAHSPNAITQDAMFADPDNGVFGVIDGMGGYANGDKAASAAAHAAYAKLEGETNLSVEDQMRSTIDAMRLAVETRGEGGNAVATVAKVYYDKQADVLRLSYGHVGDTRLFHYEAATGEIHSLTDDQSDKHIALNSLIKSEYNLDDQIGTIEVKPGDRIMMCSDGITGDTEQQSLSPEAFQDAFLQPTPGAAAARFMQHSKKEDDKSVLVVEIQDLEAAPAPVATSVPEAASTSVPAVEDLVKQRQQKRAQKKAERAAAVAVAAEAATAETMEPTVSKELQELTAMMAELKKDFPARRTAEDETSSFKIIEKRNINHLEGQFRPSKTRADVLAAAAAAPALAAEEEQGSASHQALVRLRKQGEELRAAAAGQQQETAEPETEPLDTVTEDDTEPKAKLWTWKDMMRNPGATLSVALDDYRRVRAERKAAEADYTDEAKELDKRERRRRNIILGTIGLATAMMAVRTGVEIADHMHGAVDVAAAGGFAGSDPDLNPHHQYTFQHDIPPTHTQAPAPKLELLTGTGGSTEFTQGGLNNAHEWLQNYQVKSGDTVWDLSSKYLQAHGIAKPDVYQIDAVKDSLLADFTKRGIVDGNGWLKAGQTLKF